MEKNFAHFFSLLRAGITGCIREDIDASLVDWEAIENMAIRQNVLPLVFDGYQAFFERSSKIQDSGFKPMPAELMLRWYAASQQAERHYNDHLTAIRTMTEYLAEKNFRVMILKGFSLSLCYPKPSHRPCGDIDIYCFGKYKEVDELVSTIALTTIDRSHHHHTVFRWNGVSIENHYDFINTHDFSQAKDVEKYFKELAENKNEKVENVYMIIAVCGYRCSGEMVPCVTERWYRRKIPVP